MDSTRLINQFVRRAILSICAFAAIILADHFFWQRLFAFSISPDGIPKWQKRIEQYPDFLRYYKKFSESGGGKEMVALVAIAFLFGRRVKFFYYLTAFSLDKGIGNLFKLIYSQPRPFMASQAVDGLLCQQEFGKPSGHSLSSALIGILVITDLFHAPDVDQVLRSRKVKIQPPLSTGMKCLKLINYVFWCSLALFWATMIPFSRYVLGVHSLDQIVFGSALGVWIALACRFVLREPLIIHISAALKVERQYLRDLHKPSSAQSCSTKNSQVLHTGYTFVSSADDSMISSSHPDNSYFHQVSLASNFDLKEDVKRKQTINASSRSSSNDKEDPNTYTEESSTFLAFTEESKTQQPESLGTSEGISNAEALRLEMMKSQNNQRKGSMKIVPLSNELMKPRKARAFSIASFIFFGYQAAAVFFFYFDKLKFSHGDDRQELQGWATNFYLNCHKTLDTSKYPVSIVGCGYIALSYAAYVGTLSREALMRGTSIPVQDWTALQVQDPSCSYPKFRMLGKTLVRVFASGFVMGLAVVPFILFQGMAPVVRYFLTLVLPLLLFGVYMVTLYDKVVFVIQEALDWND